RPAALCAFGHWIGGRVVHPGNRTALSRPPPALASPARGPLPCHHACLAFAGRGVAGLGSPCTDPTIRCPDCGRSNPAGSESCEHCNYPLAGLPAAPKPEDVAATSLPPTEAPPSEP